MAYKKKLVTPNMYYDFDKYGNPVYDTGSSGSDGGTDRSKQTQSDTNSGGSSGGSKSDDYGYNTPRQPTININTGKKDDEGSNWELPVSIAASAAVPGLAGLLYGLADNQGEGTMVNLDEGLGQGDTSFLSDLYGQSKRKKGFFQSPDDAFLQNSKVIMPPQFKGDKSLSFKDFPEKGILGNTARKPTYNMYHTPQVENGQLVGGIPRSQEDQANLSTFEQSFNKWYDQHVRPSLQSLHPDINYGETFKNKEGYMNFLNEPTNIPLEWNEALDEQTGIMKRVGVKTYATRRQIMNDLRKKYGYTQFSDLQDPELNRRMLAAFDEHSQIPGDIINENTGERGPARSLLPDDVAAQLGENRFGQYGNLKDELRADEYKIKPENMENLTRFNNAAIEAVKNGDKGALLQHEKYDKNTANLFLKNRQLIDNPSAGIAGHRPSLQNFLWSQHPNKDLFSEPKYYANQNQMEDLRQAQLPQLLADREAADALRAQMQNIVPPTIP